MYIYLASLLLIVRLQQLCLCFLGLKLWFFTSFQVTDTYYFFKTECLPYQKPEATNP